MKPLHLKSQLRTSICRHWSLLRQWYWKIDLIHVHEFWSSCDWIVHTADLRLISNNCIMKVKKREYFTFVTVVTVFQTRLIYVSMNLGNQAFPEIYRHFRKSIGISRIANVNLWFFFYKASIKGTTQQQKINF